MHLNPDGSFESSFLHVNRAITAAHSVLTVISGHSKAGGHASMLLEHLHTLDNGLTEARTTLIDLTTPNDNSANVRLGAEVVQRSAAGVLNTLPKMLKGGNEAQLQQMHHHCYSVNPQQKTQLIDAFYRFQAKAQTPLNPHGRYKYRLPGGALGYCLPGSRRGVNCADFVIKLLNRAGIRIIGNLLWNSPHRVAR